jgi:hypothetical protein
MFAVTGARVTTIPGLLSAALPLGTLVFVVPPIDVPLSADATDGEPTWEDAEWQ